MFKFNEPAARAVTMAALLGAILYAAPGLAATADATGASGRMLLAQSTTQGTQVQPAPGTQAPSKKPMRQRPSMEQRVDSWIKSLHTRLKITPEQESQWGQVTQIMRDNAKSMDDLLKQRAQNIKTMSAVDDLRSYQQLTQARADGMNKLIPAFETLYNSMSDAQKKNADAVFRHFERGPRSHSTAKKKSG